MKLDDQITTRVHGDTHQRIEDIAEESGLRKSDVVRRLLQTGLAIAEDDGVEELMPAAEETEQPAD